MAVDSDRVALDGDVLAIRVNVRIDDGTVAPVEDIGGIELPAPAQVIQPVRLAEPKVCAPLMTTLLLVPPPGSTVTFCPARLETLISNTLPPPDPP